ncbi:MAG: UDP-4-amino-4,6-dideoxy-N-acetyl-beta-L-altrosamine transaminase, partial [Bacteroidia bacterium]
IPYGRQTITDEDIQAVNDVLLGEYLTQGPKIAVLESAFASYVGAKYAVAISNGTAALHLCAMALDVKEGTRVITTPITFAASANCVRYCGGDVWFADIDPETFTLSLEKTRALLESKPKGFFSGIIPVDFAGLPVDLEAFRKLADEFGCWIIEDACHAPGGWFTNSAGERNLCGNGNYADLAIFSFHPVKHIAAGEGGMITTNDEALYKHLLRLRTHGITRETDLLLENHGAWYYEMQELGYNYRITDFQAALALSQLNRADAGLKRRQEIANRYTEAFTKAGIAVPFVQDGAQHAWHLYVIRIDNRKALYDQLRTKNIFCQVHYIPVHTMPYYKQFGWKKGDFPLSEDYYDKCLSLPMYPALNNEQQDYVIQCVLMILNQSN